MSRAGQFERHAEREEAAIERDYANGAISMQQRNEMLRDLQAGNAIRPIWTKPMSGSAMTGVGNGPRTNNEVPR